MRRRAAMLIFASLGLSACPSTSPNATSEGAAAKKTAAAARAVDADDAKAGDKETDEGKADEANDDGEPKPSAAQPRAAGALPRTLLVGTSKGLLEYDLDGKEVRVRASTPASRPRVLPDGSVLFLADEGKHYVLTRVDVFGTQRKLATILRGYDFDACKPIGASGGEGLGVQDDYGFRVDTAKGRACLRLADRNANMADVELEVRVELAEGEVETAVALHVDDQCVEGEGGLDCEGAYRAKPAATGGGLTSERFAWRWDPKQHLLYPKGAADPAADPKAKRLCPADVDLTDAEALEDSCAHDEGRSSSGRFVALSGGMSEGDYIHRSIFVLDLDTGELLGADDEASELSTRTIAQLFDEGAGGLDAVGESDLRWVGEGERDRLWLDGLLIDPRARRLTRLSGDLAWSL